MGPASFVNREQELGLLARWWEARGPRLAMVWGRRRVGKTALVQRFAAGRRAVFHTGTRRPVHDELRILSHAASTVVTDRDLAVNSFRDWSDAMDSLIRAADHEPLLVVLDEFPELVEVSPELPSVLRALWDGVGATSGLRLLLCGSAVRTMEATQAERAPLYGRVDLSLLLHPFRPHEAAAMLPQLPPPERALIWGIVGGVPLYLQWWDQGRSVRENLAELACRPGAPLLTEGQLILATEGQAGDLAGRVLFAVAAGRTRHNEIADAIRADPTRTLDRLVELRLLDRVVPVTEDPRRTRRRVYRVADNFLAFWLGVLSAHLVEIERGLGRGILSVVAEELDDFMGLRFEEAFRSHLRRLAERGELGRDVVAIGPYWTAAPEPVEIDAVVLAGRRREAVLLGEAKWARRVDATALVHELAVKSSHLPRVGAGLRFAVCGREEVRGSADLVITAEDIFSP
ncbi:MAG: ATP-binding protein [Candidatus Dormibacteria bacterium]